MATSYTQLRDDIASEFEDDSVEFAAQIPRFINRAQIRLTRDLDSYGLVKHATTPLANSNFFITLPQEVLYTKYLTFVTSITTTDLHLVTDEYIQDYWPVRTSVGFPRLYAMWDNRTIIVAPTPDVDGTVELGYVAYVTAIGSASVSTNYFTEFAEDAFLYASMVEATRFGKAWEQQQVWEGDYQRSLGALREEHRRFRQNDQKANFVETENTMRTGGR